MKKLLISPLLLIFVTMTIYACSADKREPPGKEVQNGLQLSDLYIKIASNGKTTGFRLFDTKAAQQFYNQLPLDLELTNFRDAQWMFYPPEKLEVTDAEAYNSGKKGELSYYQPWGDVFMLYKDFYAGDGMHRLGIPVDGINEIKGMQGNVRIEKSHNSNENPENMKLKLTIGNSVLTATLVKNSSTQALKALLAKSDLTIEMRDYGDMEKVGILGTSLPTNDERIATIPGDLILYQGNSFVIYYAPNTWSFTRLGKIDNITQQELLSALGKGNVTVTMSIK